MSSHRLDATPNSCTAADWNRLPKILKRGRILSMKAPAATFLGIECGGTRTVALFGPGPGGRFQRAEFGPANLRLLDDAALVKHFKAIRRRGGGPFHRNGHRHGGGAHGERPAADSRGGREGVAERCLFMRPMIWRRRSPPPRRGWAGNHSEGPDSQRHGVVLFWAAQRDPGRDGSPRRVGAYPGRQGKRL